MRNLWTCPFDIFGTQVDPLKKTQQSEEIRLLEQRCNNTHEVQEGIPSPNPPAVGFPRRLNWTTSPTPNKTRFL